MNQMKKVSSFSKEISQEMLKHPNPSIWTLNLVGDSKIAQRYYCELHKKRPQALLGSTEFYLPYKLTDEGILCVKREDFKKLKILFRDKIVHDPAYVGQLLSLRQRRLELLKQNIDNEYTLIESNCLKDCNPLQTFSYLTDLACFYLEYNFPYLLFKELIVEKLKYSEDLYEHLRLRLLTPYESSYLTYYSALLRLAMQKLSNTKIDLHSFRRQFSSIGDRDLRNRSDSKLEEDVQRLIFMFEDKRSLHLELMKVHDVERNIRKEHTKVKKELLLKCSWTEEPLISDLISRLSDLLIASALENEQTSIWRGRTYAYLSYLIEILSLNPRTVSIEEIQSKIR